MNEFKRWDRIIWINDEQHWYAKAGSKGVVDNVTDTSYIIGLDDGRYIYVYKAHAKDFIMLDSKLRRSME
jgi:hypothetical protein